MLHKEELIKYKSMQKEEIRKTRVEINEIREEKQ